MRVADIAHRIGDRVLAIVAFAGITDGDEADDGFALTFAFALAFAFADGVFAFALALALTDGAFAFAFALALTFAFADGAFAFALTFADGGEGLGSGHGQGDDGNGGERRKMGTHGVPLARPRRLLNPRRRRHASPTGQ